MQDNSCHDIDSSTERETRLPTGLGTAPGRHVTRSARLLKVIMLVGAVLIFALLLLMLDSIGPQFQTGTGAGPPDKSLVLRMLSDQRDNSKDMNTLLTGVREDLCHWVQIECDDGNTTAAELAGVTQNHEGTDQNGLVFALTFYGTLCIVCVLSFSFLRLYSPLPLSFFEDETEKKWLSRRAAEDGSAVLQDRTVFSWMRLSLRGMLRDDDNFSSFVQQRCGLDAAMLLVFIDLCIKLFLAVGMPLVFVLCPLHFMAGREVKTDFLDKLSMRNLINGSQLYWCHTVAVWYVVVLSMELIIHEQRKFLQRRYTWLESLPYSRKSTILVRNIPAAYQSDEALQNYFTQAFAEDCVQSANIVRQTTRLASLWAQFDKYANSTYADANQFRSHAEELANQIKIERERLLTSTEASDLSSCGFVTFKCAKDAQVALHVRFSEHLDSWVVTLPPQSEDVNWGDLMQDARFHPFKEAVGYMLIVIMYIGFTPIIVTITNFAKAWSFGPRMSALIPTAGLLLFNSFLPTILVFVFDKLFFTIGIRRIQAKLQEWYFIYQVIFVVLVTAVGSSVLTAAQTLITQPMSASALLSASLPASSNFYLNYLIIQWLSSCLELTRIWNYTKYLFFIQRGYPPDEACKLAEPEDQDYYGIGSRSTRWTSNTVIGLIFCLICPFICVLALINFLVCRLVYGYLLMFAETRKVDLGGLFWVQKLTHLQRGLWIFVTLMSGVITAGGSRQQASMATCSAVYLFWAQRRFWKYDWMLLSFERIESVKDYPESFLPLWVAARWRPRRLRSSRSCPRC